MEATPQGEGKRCRCVGCVATGFVAAGRAVLIVVRRTPSAQPLDSLDALDTCRTRDVADNNCMLLLSLLLTTVHLPVDLAAAGHVQSHLHTDEVQ
jgi:hypothetical protein